MADPDPNQSPASPEGHRAENSIRPSLKRRKESNAEAPAPKTATPDKAAAKPAHAVPAEVRDRFVVVRNKYYFHDGTRAFTDCGTRLTTASENTEVIKSLIQIAEARGWSEITVRGTERFRKEAWLAAHLAGLDVRGYRPSEFEHGRVARTVARQGPAPTEDSVTPAANAPPPREELLSGRLVDHGRATYRHDARQPMSYFVKLETERGDRTIWGVDLERAFKESLTAPDIGDEVGLRAVRQEAVKVRRQERDAAGVGLEREFETHRNRWIVERRGFFEGRAEAAQIVRDASLNPKEVAKKHPELVGSLLELHLARLAAQKLHPEDRERFVATHRTGLAERIARGEPLPVVRLRERAAARAPKPPERENAPVRG
jgi:putative DNA primase/helicase